MKYRIFCLVLLVSYAAAQTGQWSRTKCGPGDQVSEWGLRVDPKNILPEYPRPQLVRPDNTYKNLNGLWGFAPGSSGQQPPFGRTLNTSVLVPFPIESCLSGIGQTHKYLWYRTIFDKPAGFSERILLQFGAVDWQTTAYVNRNQVGQHTGGYDAFTFDITSHVQDTNNELIVGVYDPSDEGFQPNGKQRISAINNPGGDTYTPASGIWQTVWLEHVPKTYIQSIKITANLKSVTLSAVVSGSTENVKFEVLDGNTVVATGTAAAGQNTTIDVPSPRLWEPSNPFLYGLKVSIASETVSSYFGMRTFTLGHASHPSVPDTGVQMNVDRPGGDLPGYPVQIASDPNVCWNLCKQHDNCHSWAYGIPNCGGSGNQALCWLKSGNPGTIPNQQCRASGELALPARVVGRPLLNDKFLFLAGWLDQSWWPDGIYTAPSDEALAFDLKALSTFGLNVVRLHQKVNSQRWYWHADRLGVVVLQDMIQKYGGASAATVQPFMNDLRAMIAGVYNHPSIVQWTVFNEGDCVGSFNVPQTVAFAKSLDSSRLFDTNSGGPGNDLHIADVNDIHTYPYPGDPAPGPTQYGMLGEYGGVGAFVAGREWVPKQCQTYLHVNTPQDEADTYIQMTQTILSKKEDISVAIYTQITDVERECDGFLNFDRTNKFNEAQTQAIREANLKLIHGEVVG